MGLIQFFQGSLLAFLVVIFVFSLLVGSFLNVVIFRLPKIMQAGWRAECNEFLGHKTGDTPEKISLSYPASTCPHCGHKIRPWENIPILSYLFLRGRCSNCSNPISIRYPLIEALTGILAVFVAWHFGVTFQFAGILLLTYALIALSMIDVDHQLLPDNITLPFLWLGLFLNSFGLYTDLHSAVIGAIAGYLSLWSVYWLFKLLTGKEGMGYGDFKLLALFGAWLGWQFLPQIILLSSLVGAVIGISMIVIRGRDRNIPIPFGPYLAIAGFISILYGPEINQSYLQFAGLA
jgi:leader peptidase (prepilin peptidase)/N-methyltransferase